MPLSNAEKQARWRARNVIALTRDADDIAEHLIEMSGQDQDGLREVVKKLRKVASFVDDHLRHPDRTPNQRAVALGRSGVDSLNGPLSKLAAIAAVDKPEPLTSWLVEVVDNKGQRWRNGVRLGSKAEAEAYGDVHAREQVPGYVTAKILPSDDPPVNNMTRKRKGGRLYLGFEHGKCGSLQWERVRRRAEATAKAATTPKGPAFERRKQA